MASEKTINEEIRNSKVWIKIWLRICERILFENIAPISLVHKNIGKAKNARNRRVGNKTLIEF